MAYLRPGNSHSRGFQPLLAIPDAPPAFIRHRRRQATVPLGAAMASPNQVQFCTRMITTRARILLSRAFASALLPPLAARACQPNQVQCFTLSAYGPGAHPTLPGVRKRAASVRGTRIVAAFSRSLRFPTLRLPSSATGGGRLRSHWRRALANLTK